LIKKETVTTKNVFSEESIVKDFPAKVEHSASSYGYNIKGSGTGIKVAILDTGKTDHLAIKEIKDSINFSSSHTVYDTTGQSTIVSGIIAGNNDKILGIAPGVDLYYAKIIDDDGKVEIDAFVSSVLWAIIKQVDVIVVSMTTDISSDIFNLTIEKATKNNICVVCSAGHKGYTHYPAAYPSVLSVGALSQNGKIANFSLNGAVNEVGTSICSTYLKQTYCVASGSSIATAIIGGATALVLKKMKSQESFDLAKVYGEIKSLKKEK